MTYAWESSAASPRRILISRRAVHKRDARGMGARHALVTHVSKENGTIGPGEAPGAKRLPVHVETLEVGPLGCNCSIVADLAAREAIVVDPGGDLALLEERLRALDVRVRAIVHTHTHIDHVGCTAELQREALRNIHHAGELSCV